MVPDGLAAGRRRLRVGVLVDLPLRPDAGGHVKCWERLSQAAPAFADRLDLTVHFLGEAAETRPVAENVRYALAAPVFSTARLPFLSHVPEHTDLAPWHRGLARALRGYDVIHTTDAYFSFARTATRVAARHGIPLVSSVHTNTPEYTRIFTGQLVERLAGRGALGRFLLDRLGFARRAEQRMLRRLIGHQRRCAFVLVSRPDQLANAMAWTGGRAALFRRGIDRALFDPARRDRGWLAERFGIPADRTVVLFTGRVNRAKNVPVLTEALAAEIAAGRDLQLFCAGEGDERRAIAERLGPRATCPGNLPPELLARVYAAADIFAFPSAIEEYANVVLEALSSGLPVLVAGESGMARLVVEGETGHALPAESLAGWARTIGRLAGDAGRRARMARAARAWAERHLPSWADVLGEDLLPRWQQAAEARFAGR